MALDVRNGELRVSVKVFYLLSFAMCATFLLCTRMIFQRESTTLPVCQNGRTAIPGHIKRPRLAEQHRACTKDPIVHNTPDSCPHCFRPRVHNISTEFTQIPREVAKLPRGPSGFFQPRALKQQDVIEDTLIEPSSVCRDICPYIVALQMSMTSMLEERNAIRSTWASVAKTRLWPHRVLNADLQLIFVLAHQLTKTRKNSTITRKPVKKTMTWKQWALVKAEADRYGDVLYLDMMDSYYNLSLKVISALQWARDHCPRTKFFLKVDADTFVNVPLMVDLLIYNQALLELSITGYIYRRSRVFRNGRWAISKTIYPVDVFPLYTSGCAYILSNQALTKVLECFPYVPMLDLEDVFVTGLLGRAARVSYFTERLNSLFTSNHLDDWEWCEFMKDHRVVGTGVEKTFKMRLLWSGFVLNDWICQEFNFIQMYCQCSEEFPQPPEPFEPETHVNGIETPILNKTNRDTK